MNGLPNERYAYTDGQVAEFLKLSVKQVQEMMRRGEIPARKVGRYWRVPVAWFEEWWYGKQTAASREQATA